MKRKILLVILLSVFMIFIAACSSAEEPSLTDLKADLQIGLTINVVDDFLLPKYIGEADKKGKFNHSITWESRNEDIISIGELNEAGTHYPATVHATNKVEDLILVATITLNNKDKDSIIKTFNISVSALTHKLSTAEAKAIAVGSIVEISGVISYVNASGIFVKDETGVMYVYLKTAHAYIAGDEVTVTGTRANYNNMPQIGDSPAPVIVKGTSGTYTRTLEEFTYEDIKDLGKEELSFYGKVFELEGILKESTETNTPYILKELGSDKFIGINSYSIAPALTELQSKVGKYVKLTLLTYDYFVPASNSVIKEEFWRFLYIGESLEELSLDALSDSTIVALAKENLIDSLEGKIVYEDLSLPISQFDLVTIAWESDNVAISSEGVYTAPEADVAVKLTATLSLGAVEETLVINVTAKEFFEQTELNVIINEAYGGGGNKEAEYKNDFIELYNPTDEDIDITGWTIWYASATGLFKEIGSESYETGYVLTGVIKAKSFFLIQAAAGNAGTLALPTPDATCGIAMGAAGFKIALTNNNVMPTGPSSANIVDFVGAGGANLFEGAGPAPAPSNTKSISRKNFIDTNDNALNFEVTSPSPKNSQSN